MYRCQKCQTVVGPHQKMNKIVAETRPKTYPVFRTVRARRRGDEPERELVASAAGFEIAKELEVCASCAAAYAEETAA